MDPRFLVDEQIDAGAAVLRRLDEENIPVRGAFWSYDHDAGEWRYVIATPLTESEGPRSVYERIQRALLGAEDTKNFPIWRLVTVSPKSELIRLVRRLVGRLDNPKGMAHVVGPDAPPDLTVQVYRMA